MSGFAGVMSSAVLKKDEFAGNLREQMQKGCLVTLALRTFLVPCYTAHGHKLPFSKGQVTQFMTVGIIWTI